MTDTDRIAKALMDPNAEQTHKDKEKKDEASLTPPAPPAPTGQDDDDNDMSLVNEAMGTGLKVNTGGKGGQLISQDELNDRYAEMASKIGENAQAKRDAVPKAVESAEKKEHNDEISRLENEYRASTKEDTTAAMERVGAKEVLEVPNYREHVTDDQMQGWGRALASFGSVGLKQGANAIDAATKALGEFRKLTRAFLSPNPMSSISQTVASTMVGFNTMYDTIDKAGELAGIKQGADKSIVMETQKGAQYYKDKDNATKVANFIMQSFNDQIRDTLGPQGDVTQLNPAQFTRIYEKMKDGFFDSEMERIEGKHRAGLSLSLEDKAIVNGWKNLNENYKKVLKDKQSTANEYAKEVGVHEKAINDLDKQYGKDVKAYDRAIAAIDKDERAQQRSLGTDYKNDSKSIRGGTKTVDAWRTGFDNAVKNKDSIGALIRMTLGPEANRRLKDGNALLKTIEGAQNQANSNATNPNFTPEQREKWLKIANVFGKRVQTVRNMSTEQRRQYALRLSGAANFVEGAPKAGGRTSKEDDDPYGFLGATKKQRDVIVNMTPKQYSDKKIAKWKENHVLETDQANSVKHRNLYKGAMDIVGKMAEEERKAYQNPRMTPEERAQTLEKMEGLKNRLFDLENTLWDRKSLEANDVFDESYRKVYNGMGREDYLKTLPNRKKDFPRAKGKSKPAREYNVLMEDYEGRKDELDMLRYDFLNGEFKDWRERRNAILKGRHLNRLLDDQRDRLSTMYNVLSRASKKGLLPGHSFEYPEPSGEEEQVDEKSDGEESIDVAQGPTDEGRIESEGRAEEAMKKLKSRIDSVNEQLVAQNDTEQKNNEGDAINERVDEEPVVDPEVPESDDIKAPEVIIESSTRSKYETEMSKRLYDRLENILNDETTGTIEKKQLLEIYLSDVDWHLKSAREGDYKKQLQGFQSIVNRAKEYLDKANPNAFERVKLENKEDETVGADVQGESSANDTEPKEEFDTISGDLKTIDKEGLERRIADLKGLDQDDPQVADLLRMAQERLGAEQSENRKEPVVEPEIPESDDTVISEETAEPPVRSTYETPGAIRYNDKFRDVEDNTEESDGWKRDEIATLISLVDKELGRIRANESRNPNAPKLISELEQLKTEMNRAWEEHRDNEFSAFNKEQQEKNAENPEVVKESNPNSEHRETFIPNTSTDESKIRTPSEDSRKVDSKELLGKLPEAEEVPKKDDRKETIAAISNLVESTLGEGSTVFRGLDFKKWYRNPETKKISWKGQPGQVMQKVFDNERSWFNEMNDRITDSENPKELRKQIKARYNKTLKSLKFIKDNFSPINKRSKLNNELKWLKESMEKSFRFIYAHDPEKLGGLEPYLTAKESAERSKNPKPDPVPDDGTTNARTNTKNSSKRGTRTRMTPEEKQKKIEATWENNEKAFGMSNDETLKALEAVKDRISEEDLNKYLTHIRNSLYNTLRQGGVSQKFKDELANRFKELAPPGYDFKFNWDVKTKNDKINLIRMEKLPNERSLGEKIADPNWTPSNKEVEYIKDNADIIRRDHFGGDKDKLIARFPFLKSATPSFEELLKAKLNERYGHFTG